MLGGVSVNYEIRIVAPPVINRTLAKPFKWTYAGRPLNL